MMKKRTIFLILLAVAVIMSGCSKGNAGSVDRIVGDSDIYDAAAIEEAMDTAIAYFKNEFEGCTLTQIEYNEEKSEKAAQEWAEQYHEDEAIVLISSFEVDASGGDGSLNPSSTYNGWQWILTRSNGGKWTLRTWGYG